MIWVTPLQVFFGTVPLGARELLEAIALGSLVPWVDEARKVFARRRPVR